MWASFGHGAEFSCACRSFFVGKSQAPGELPSYHQLTFRRGTIYSARFGVAGDTVVFSATWNGNPLDIYELRSGTADSGPLGLTNVQVLAVSANGEMAVLLNSQHLYHAIRRGTLARMPLSGGAPREDVENVQEADWGPDGSVAVVRFAQDRIYLKYQSAKFYTRLRGISLTRAFLPKVMQ